MNNLIVQLITDSVKEKMGNGYNITTQDITKNNGLILKGLLIRKEDEKICPTIYLNSFVDDYLNNVPLEKIVDHIIHIYQENKTDNFDISAFFDFDKVKDKIIYQLINTSKNTDLLKDIPSIPYLDLSIIFKVLVDFPVKTKDATVTIHNSHMNMWNASTDEIYSFAKVNTPILMPAKLESIHSILEKICPASVDETISSNDLLPMYVLSNTQRINGSGCILYPDILANFADAAGSDIYVLPSSVHETILLTDIPNHVDTNYLKQMVCEVNATEVSAEEVLSNNVYLFSKETKGLSII